VTYPDVLINLWVDYDAVVAGLTSQGLAPTQPTAVMGEWLAQGTLRWLDTAYSFLWL
jgi:hypothetical protein